MYAAGSGCAEEDIDVVCVTGGPGLLLCLKVGFVAGAMLAHHLRKPFVVVNHLEVAYMRRSRDQYIPAPSQCFHPLAPLAQAHALVSRLLVRRRDGPRSGPAYVV